LQLPIKIYCPDPSARHRYIFDLLFKELLGTDYVFIDEINTCHINYSKDSGGLWHILPQGLLSEKDIKSDIQVVFENIDNQWFMFRTNDASKTPFDVFAASFYLVSRYEEYLPYEADDHNRFSACFSCLTQNDLLEEPLINKWALYIKNILSSSTDLRFIPRKFEFLSTIDVDQAWKFKNKGLFRNVLGTFRDLKEGKWENFRDRWPVLFGLRKDPFHEAFSWHKLQETKYDIKLNYFMLLGDYGTFDKNTSHKNSEFVKFIQSLDSADSIGIHPSYNSNTEKPKVAQEINRLESILCRPIVMSRQHFLMHRMPETYQTLIKNGITEDHTMGYSTHLGFRAGIAAPFYWFDLENNIQTKLKLVPFCAMDITPLHYRKESPDKAIKTLRNLMEKVNDVGGLFVSLWHNESFSETERWRGWRVVYESLLAKASKS
jgi:hypothetical protein